jgi:AbiU2
MKTVLDDQERLKPGRRSELDVGERAAERAALSLIDGDRSGRLDLRILDAQKLASRILKEAQAASKTWVMAAELSAVLRSDPHYANGLDHVGSGGLLTIHHSLIEHALMAAFRLSDAPGQDRTTLCSVAALFQAGEIKPTEDEWLRHLGYRSHVMEWTRDRNRAAADRYLALVPSAWPSPTQDAGELAQLRRETKPFRDKQLAHFILMEPDAVPTYGAAGRLIDLTLDLATDAALLLKGAAVEADAFREHAREDARLFWGATLEGPRQKFLDHAEHLQAES